MPDNARGPTWDGGSYNRCPLVPFDSRVTPVLHPLHRIHHSHAHLTMDSHYMVQSNLPTVQQLVTSSRPVVQMHRSSPASVLSLAPPLDTHVTDHSGHVGRLG